MTRLHLFSKTSLQKNFHIFSSIQVSPSRCSMSHFLCYLKIILPNTPKSFKGETQHSTSQISPKKEKELKNNPCSKDSIVSMHTLASKCMGLGEVIWSNSTAQAGRPRASCPGPCSARKPLQEWRFHNLSEYPVPMPGHPHSKIVS